MSDCIVYYPDGFSRPVKNLGWLLAHRNDGITNVQVISLPTGGYDSARLDVTFRNGVIYRTDFADLSVCMNWISRYLRNYMDPINFDSLAYKFQDRLIRYTIRKRAVFGWAARPAILDRVEHAY